MRHGTKLQKAISVGAVKVTVLKGGDSYSCPKCKSYNAMCLRGTVPEGFEECDLRNIGLSEKRCRDCGHETISQMNGFHWVNESTHQLFVDGKSTPATCVVSNIHTIDEQHKMVAQIMWREIKTACKSFEDVETRHVDSGSTINNN